MDKNDVFKHLYDGNGNFLGVFFAPELWSVLSPEIEPHLEKLFRREPEVPYEPMDDWDMLEKFWDFRYPLSRAVVCDLCGNETENWTEDEPREFYLKAANMGGLVSFQCCRCKGRVNKRHFKDKVSVDCKPFVEKK